MVVIEKDGDNNRLTEQSERFIDAAKELDCDEDEGRWNERLKKVAQQKPEPEKPE